MPKNPVMTVPEVCRDLKQCGVNWSEATVRTMIREEQFPGATCRRRCFVFTKEYENWKKDKGLEHIKPVIKEDKYTKAVMEFENAMKEQYRGR